MTVCMLLYSYWPLQVGGAETQCRRLTHALAARNVHSIVITARCKKELPAAEQDGTVIISRCFVFQLVVESILSFLKKRKRTLHDSVRHVGKEQDAESKTEQLSHRNIFFEQAVNWLNSFFFIAGVSWTCFSYRKQIDILHVHSTEWVAGLAVVIGKHLKIPVICKEASSPAFLAETSAVPFGRFFETYRFCGNYIALTAAVKEQMLRRRIDERKIFLIPNGVPIPENAAAASQRNAVLWIGNFSQGIHVKGIDILFDAWKIVKQSRPDVCLLLVGGGDASAAMQEARKRHLEDVIDIAGYSTRVEEHYQKAALFVLPSRIEGMSNTLLEAHAWGIPSIASDIPANRAVILEGETGFLVPIQNPSLLGERILQLLSDSSLSERMGKRAREHAQRNFSIDRIAEQHCSCYKILRERQLMIFPSECHETSPF